MRKEKWIDISKGIVILLVIFEHSLMKIDFVAKSILMFHMPFFFFISGLCFNSNMSNEEERKWRRKNLKKYIKIYSFFTILGLIWCFIKSLVFETKVDWIFSIFNVFYCNQVLGKLVSGGMWFIVTLLICKILFSFVVKIFNKFNIYQNTAILIILYIISILLNKIGCSYLPFCLDNVRFTIIFYYLGYICKRYKITESMEKRNYLFLILGLVLLIVTTLFNEVAVMMHANIYGNYLLFIIGSISGIMFVTSLSKALNKRKISKLFEYFGKDTLYFFTMQFMVLDCVKVIICKFINAKYIIQSILVFICTILILIPIDFIMKKYFSKIFNK